MYEDKYLARNPARMVVAAARGEGDRGRARSARLAMQCHRRLTAAGARHRCPAARALAPGTSGAPAGRGLRSGACVTRRRPERGQLPLTGGCGLRLGHTRSTQRCCRACVCTTLLRASAHGSGKPGRHRWCEVACSTPQVLRAGCEPQDQTTARLSRPRTAIRACSVTVSVL